VLGLAACVCLVVAGAAGGLAFLMPSRSVSTTPTASVSRVTPLAASPLPPTTSATQSGSPTQAVSPTEANATSTTTAKQLSPEILRVMDQIEQQTRELRGLSSTLPVTRTLITTDELREKYEADFQEDYSPDEASDDVVELSALRLVEPNFDFYNFYLEFLVESVAGYYDTDVRTMYIVQGQGFGGNEKFTYSHEYTHFLQDMTWNIRDGLNYTSDSCDLDSERCAGIQSLIEGDASLSSLTWLTTDASQRDIQDIQNFYNSYESPIFDSAPPFMQEDLSFPYQTGMEFVQSLYDSGGWDGVDAAYQNLPDSTEQILHPDRYPDDQPIQVDIPEITSTLGSGWHMLEENTIGEWYTYLILAKGIDPSGQLDDQDARSAAEGWGGDRYVVFYNEDSQETVLVVHYQWDTDRDARQFADAFRESTNSLYGNPASNSGGLTTWQSDAGYTLFSEVEEETVWILAPDQATAEEILSRLDEP
jgi:hypothetical protein